MQPQTCNDCGVVLSGFDSGMNGMTTWGRDHKPECPQAMTDRPAQSAAPAEAWLNEHYPKDDSPPFGDESLRDSPSYETTHIVMRDEIPEMLEAYAAHRRRRDKCRT